MINLLQKVSFSYSVSISYDKVQISILDRKIVFPLDFHRFLSWTYGIIVVKHNQKIFGATLNENPSANLYIIAMRVSCLRGEKFIIFHSFMKT